MYKKKIPFDIDCGIKITMEVIGGKWKSCIIQELCTGPKRPSELHRLFTEASPRVINQQLKELEMHGIISKKIFMELPPHSEYGRLHDTNPCILSVCNGLQHRYHKY